MTVSWTLPAQRELYLDQQVKKHNWMIGVEVGVRFGRVLFYLLDHNPTLKMYAVDNNISQFYNSSVATKYGDRLMVLEGTSWEQAKRINHRIDFCFIDAGHGTKSVVRDIEAYQPLLKTDRGLIGHDVDYPSVQQALDICQIKFDVGPDNVWHKII